MRALILVAGAALAVSACSSNEAAENTTDLNAVDANVIVDTNDLTSIDAVNDTDANLALDANTANAVAADLTTNTPDANLANGI